MMTSMVQAAPSQPPRLRDRAWWPWLTRGSVVVFVLFVLGLLVWQAGQVEWAAVFTAIQATPVHVLLAAGAVAVCGHLMYASFDLLGRWYTGHALPRPMCMLVTFISYAFNLNFGAVVGGGGMRLRLYSQLRLPTATILRVIGMSMWTNWFGYLVLAGIAFLWLPVALPPDWHVGANALHLLGAVLLLVALGYLGVCARWPGRRWHWRGHAVWLPPARVALTQLAMSTANWLLVAAVIWVLMPHPISFPAVATVYLVGVVVGIVTRVPAGLGVQEAVFVTLLSGQVPKVEILAAMLTYRALYYWGPLVIAGLSYAALEARLTRRA